jgi:hypothetical protein
MGTAGIDSVIDSGRTCRRIAKKYPGRFIRVDGAVYVLNTVHHRATRSVMRCAANRAAAQTTEPR